jgi:hypothetical protein
MAIIPNTITSADTIEAVNDEFISRYREEVDRFAEVIGISGVETVNAGTALYKYVVTGQLADTAIDPGTIVYEKTKDTEVVQGKTYYTKSGDTYSSVGSPTKAGLKDYYVAYASAGSSSGKTYVEGDEITLSHFKVEKVPVGEVNFMPYRLLVTAQAIQRGGLQNAYYRVVEKARKQMRGDAVADMFGWLNDFAGATATAPESGTWNLQQLLAHTDEKLLNTMESANESDLDIVHFVNRSDAYGYLADATITMQDVFGLTYLENFLGIERVFLTNKVTAGTVVATPASNIHIYAVDYGTINRTGLDYQVDDFGMVGIAYAPERDHAGIGVYPVRSMTIIPEKDAFVVRGAANPS